MDSSAQNQLNHFQLRVTSAHHNDYFNDCAFSPDGAWLASASSDHTARIWDVATGKLLHTLVAHNRGVQGVAWSPDGKLLASASNDQSVCLWEAMSGRLLRKLIGHGEVVESVHWSADGKQVISGSYRGYDNPGSPQGRMCVWDAASGTLLSRLPEGKSPKQHPAKSADGRFTASRSTHDIEIKDTASGAVLRKIQGHWRGVQVFAWSRDDQWLADCSDVNGRVWEAATGKMRLALQGWDGAEAFAWSLAWSPDGQRLARHIHKDIKIWNMTTGALSSRLVPNDLVQGDYIKSLAWSAGGERLMYCLAGEKLFVWEAESGQLVRTHDIQKSLQTVATLSAEGKLLFVRHDNHINVWATSNGKLLHSWKGLCSWARQSMTLSADNNCVVTFGEKDTLQLWHVPTGRLMRTLEGCAGYVSQLAISPDLRWVAATQSSEVIVWDVQTGKLRQTFATGLPLHGIQGIAFVPLSARFATFGQTPQGELDIVVTMFPLSA